MPTLLCPLYYAHFIMPTLLCPLYYAHFIMPTLLCPLYYAHFIMPTLLCPLYYTHFIMPTLLCPLYYAHFIMPTLLCPLYYAHFWLSTRGVSMLKSGLMWRPLAGLLFILYQAQVVWCNCYCFLFTPVAKENTARLLNSEGGRDPGLRGGGGGGGGSCKKWQVWHLETTQWRWTKL